ncbi:hypothetical protein ABIA32_000541 [Streptacidiphilus sp. MAP12-20]|uniref:hypothetical protein n=1 Tax=Streptacidiphilus sp. MAP12-20 TaxID=3156299 RepID=UPI00351723EE
MLSLLGLSPVARVVYAEMLEHPDYGLSELVASSGLPEHQGHGACDELADLALLRPSRERPGALRTVSLQVGLDLVLRRQEAELARRAARTRPGARFTAQPTLFVSEDQLATAHQIVSTTGTYAAGTSGWPPWSPSGRHLCA